MTMLRSILVALGAAACLFAFAAMGDVPGGPVGRAFAGVGLGVGVTALVYGQATFLAVALGAVSPLAFAVIGPVSPGAAATALCLLWLAPRVALCDTRRRLGAMLVVSIAAAAIAGSIFASYADAPLAAHAASCVFAGSCLSLVGIVVPLPTTTAYALRATAEVIDGPVREDLLRAAQAHEASRWEPRTSAARRKWMTIVRLSDRRAALSHATAGEAVEKRRELDERIRDLARDLSPLTATPSGPGEGAAPPDAPVSHIDDIVTAQPSNVELKEAMAIAEPRAASNVDSARPSETETADAELRREREIRVDPPT